MNEERNYATRLVDAESEEEIGRILDEMENNEVVEWVPIGKKENNYSAIEGGPRPIQAFTELITNADDAILHRIHREKFGDEPREDILTYEDAERILLDDEDVEIKVIADGIRGNPPNLIVEDNGIGQPPQEFEEAFFGLYEAGARKREWPFQQGQFGKGGTAVLPRSGEKGHKLVISASHRNPEMWSWSITRKNRPKHQYEYLKLNGSIPKFRGGFWDKEFGTIVKVFEYDYGPKTHMPTQLRIYLRAALWDVPIPIRLIENRDYPESSPKAVFKGGFDGVETHPHLIDKQWTRTYDFGDELGKRQYRVIVAKSDPVLNESEKYREGVSTKRNNITGLRKIHTKQSVFFLVNGQTHGNLGESFIHNRCNKPQTAEDVLVFMDFSDWGAKRESWSDLTDLFVPDRYRLSEKKLADQITAGLEDALKNDPELKKVENRRRKRSITQRDDEKLEDMLEKFIRDHPATRRYLTTGVKASLPGLDEDEASDFDPPFFPTKFNIIKDLRTRKIWEEDRVFVRRQAVNRRSRINFELDAPNDYFDRGEAQGQLRFEPSWPVKSHGLSEGVLSVELAAPEDDEEGDVVEVDAVVTRQFDSDLKQNFKIEYVEPAPKSTKGGRSERNPTQEQFDLPEINEVPREKWGEHGWGENDVLSIWDDEENRQFNINVDAAPLQNFLTENNIANQYHDDVTRMWKIGITLYGLGMYIELNQATNGDEIDDVSTIVATSMKGVAQTMLDQHIDDDRLQYIMA